MRDYIKFTIVTSALLACSTIFTGCAQQKMTRYGSVIGLRAEKLEEYKKLHADVWPGVLKQIKECNINNYSIYLGELEKGQFYLFAYFEYTGDDFEADMEKMAADPTTQRWWSVCEPCQIPLPLRKEGEWWANMEEVFHQD
jgi:L-rhamnose mutarotase